MPERIQIVKGERLPEGAVSVGRRTQWANPFKFHNRMGGLAHYGPKHLERFGRAWDHEGRISAPGMSHYMHFAADDVVETYVRWGTRAELVELFRLTLTEPTWGMRLASPSCGGRFTKYTVEDVLAKLAGRDLACECRLTWPCHADVLLELANPVVAASMHSATSSGITEAGQ